MWDYDFTDFFLLISFSIDEDFEDVELVSPTDIIFKQPQSPYKVRKFKVN